MNICAVRTFIDPTYLKPDFNLERLPHEPLLYTQEHRDEYIKYRRDSLHMVHPEMGAPRVGAPIKVNDSPVCKHCGSLFYVAPVSAEAQ